MATNHYGLDVSYFESKLSRIQRDINNYTPSEFARELARMAVTANKKILNENEFSKPDELNILDACCGSKMFWFDKQNKSVLFNDIRKLETNLCDGRKLEVNPDLISDFRDMPFKSKSFNIVVFDPPHLEKVGNKSWLALKYGKLQKGWKEDLTLGFSECFRVLKNNGVLIFKWNETDIKTSEILNLCDYEPLIGHPSGKRANTHWVLFVKSEFNKKQGDL